jgi:hypothetical protein
MNSRTIISTLDLDSFTSRVVGSTSTVDEWQVGMLVGSDSRCSWMWIGAEEVEMYATWA